MPLVIRAFAAIALSAVAVGTATAGQLGATPAKTAPELRVVKLAPLTFDGYRFVARERVRVTVTAASDQRVRFARANLRGRFRVAFPQLTVGRCNGTLVARAVGAAGSRAALKLPELLCAPSLRAPGP